jgi:hypothetical protein
MSLFNIVINTLLTPSALSPPRRGIWIVKAPDGIGKEKVQIIRNWLGSKKRKFATLTAVIQRVNLFGRLLIQELSEKKR